MIDTSPDAHFLTDLAGTIVDANQASETLTGYAPKRLIGSSLRSLGLLSRIHGASVPDMGGAQLIDAIQARRSNTAFLLVSGYAGPEVRSKKLPDAGVPFLQKPWSAEELLVRVREILDAGPEAPQGGRRKHA